MKIDRMDYVNTKDFDLNELMEFESLIVKSGHLVDEEIDFSQINTWAHYGVTSQGYTGFYDCYFEDSGGRNVSEQFRKYLDSLDSTEEQPVEEDTIEETPTENLSIKDRLLALADEKDLEYFTGLEWHLLESESAYFGDILYDEGLKVRVKVAPEKSKVEVLFEKYCCDNGYDPEQTDFTTFKAGYEAAKNND